ncbi:MAG: hypothetical protein ACRDTR_07220, partial [Rubrobacter sp.]
EETELITRGHVVVPEGEYADLPRVQAAGIDPETGERLATTDPRSGGQASLGQGSSSALPDTGGPSLAQECGVATLAALPLLCR